jgi:Rrf2 family protein
MAMRVTRMADYGVRFMIELAMRPAGARATASELARASGASSAFAGKILQRLVSARLLVSHTGHDGGFELERAAAQITMLDIVSALEGPLCLNECLPGGAGCSRKQWCPGHGVWANAQGAVAHVLSSERLDRLAAEAVRNRMRLNLPVPTIDAPKSEAPANA